MKFRASRLASARKAYRQTSRARPELRVEAHLLDFDENLYDREVEIVFVEKLRGEKQFASLKELREQIAHDILDAQMRF